MVTVTPMILIGNCNPPRQVKVGGQREGMGAKCFPRQLYSQIFRSSFFSCCCLFQLQLSLICVKYVYRRFNIRIYRVQQQGGRHTHLIQASVYMYIYIGPDYCYQASQLCIYRHMHIYSYQASWLCFIHRFSCMIKELFSFIALLKKLDGTPPPPPTVAQQLRFYRVMFITLTYPNLQNLLPSREKQLKLMLRFS